MDRIWLAGHNGLVGRAIQRALLSRGVKSVFTFDRKEVDLLDQGAVDAKVKEVKPRAIILAAAKVGGIGANNTYRTEFLYENLAIQNNVIMAAHRHNVEKFVFLGSSCIYPKEAPQPMSEMALLTSPLEITNRPYALAKICGLDLIANLRYQYNRNYFSVMPPNLYGPHDNFHPQHSHVFPALIRRFVEAKEASSPEVCVWGTGAPLREFMHVDDCAKAVLFFLETVNQTTFKGSALEKNLWSHINIGSSAEISIKDLASLIARLTGYRGQIVFDPSKPDGTMRKLMDSSEAKRLGWKPEISIEEGVLKTIQWFKENAHSLRAY